MRIADDARLLEDGIDWHSEPKSEREEIIRAKLLLDVLATAAKRPFVAWTEFSVLTGMKFEPLASDAEKTRKKINRLCSEEREREKREHIQKLLRQIN